MLNIYDFIPSSDIADYCRDIAYSFSPIDMAVIIAISEKTTPEKHAAWQVIINDYPDMPIHGNEVMKPKESLQDYLQARITREEQGFEDDDAEDIELLFIHLPVPFKRNDLLTMPCGNPGVLYHLTHWWNGPRFKYKDFVSGKTGAFWDMAASFYFIDINGNLVLDHTDPNSLYDLTYYHKNPEGKHSVLSNLSVHLNQDFMRINQLLRKYRGCHQVYWVVAEDLEAFNKDLGCL